MAEGAQSVEVNERRRFAAFMSYAHADAFIAAKLQARLERYRLPKHLAQAHTGGQAALGQIFRDREDMAATPSLSDAIRDAISEAEALIVICSPDAVASRWVGEEIALFRTLHPDRPILAAVVRGAPEEALPAALTEGGTEPLAADLRKEADGQSLGFLKIVAGIAGVPLDALVQRDAQRRIRRVMWITGSALAAMLIMGIMTTLALQARNEAARQRAEAEGLVEYMLTDLREKLKGVGRLDVMEGVNKRALKYYGNESIKGRVLKARVLHAQGDDERLRDNISGALAKFRQADEITAELYAKHRDNPDAVFAHAQSNYWLGYGEELRSNTREALRRKLEYAELVMKFAQLSNGSRSAQKELGWAHNTLGAAYLKNRDTLNKAIIHFEKYFEIFSALVESQQDDSEARYSLMDANGWMADAQIAAGELAEGRKHREEQVRQLDILIAADGANMNWRLRRGIALRGLARILKKQGDVDQALDVVDRSLIQLNPTAGFDPANAEWRNELIYAHIDRGFYGKLLLRRDIVRTAYAAATTLIAKENQHPHPLNNLSDLVSLTNQLKN